MEMNEIYDCQKVLKFATEIKTEEERQCDQLFKNPDTVIWLKERRGYLDQEIKAIERKVSEGEAHQDLKEKKKAQEAINTKINELENNKKDLVRDLDKIPHEIFYQIDCSGVDFSKVTTPPRCGTIETAVHKDLKAKITEIECSIKKYDSEIYDKEQKKYKTEEQIKNKDSNVRDWEGKVNDARREVNYAENNLSNAIKEGEYIDIGLIKIPKKDTWGECWNLHSPELRNWCVQEYREKVQEKVRKLEESKKKLVAAKEDLAKKDIEKQILSDDIKSLHSKRNEEISKKEQYIKDKEESESKMQGMLDQKKSLETDIEKQKAEQIKINEELAALQENAKNFDHYALETQKAEILSELYNLPKIIGFIDEYVEGHINNHQHQEL